MSWSLWTLACYSYVMYNYLLEQTKLTRFPCLSSLQWCLWICSHIQELWTPFYAKRTYFAHKFISVAAWYVRCCFIWNSYFDWIAKLACDLLLLHCRELRQWHPTGAQGNHEACVPRRSLRIWVKQLCIQHPPHDRAHIMDLLCRQALGPGSQVAGVFVGLCRVMFYVVDCK